MKEELTINGRLFVTASYGSQLVDYTSDYIGQLARDGKITSEKIGRTLYVDQYDLIQYAEKKSVSGAKRGPKQEEKKSKTEDTLLVRIPRKSEIENSQPLSYSKEETHSVKINRSVELKNENVDNQREQEDAQVNRVVKQVVPSNTFKMSAVRPVDQTAGKTSTRVKVSIRKTVLNSLILILLVISCLGMFAEVHFSYSQTSQMDTSYHFQLETFSETLEKVSSRF